MKSKKLIVITGLLLVLQLFISCEVYFSVPQPSWIKKNEKVIPGKFRGTFTGAENGVLREMHKGGKGAEVKVSEKRIYIDNENDFNLSDTVILRKYRHHYFLNIYNAECLAWSVILIKEADHKIYYYMIPSEESENMTRLRKIAVVNQSDHGARQYIINPTKKEFIRMLKSDVFSPMDTLTRIQ